MQTLPMTTPGILEIDGRREGEIRFRMLGWGCYTLRESIAIALDIARQGLGPGSGSRRLVYFGPYTAAGDVEAGIESLGDVKR